MTTNERRLRELEVIEAAGPVVDSGGRNGWMDLANALHALRKMPLETPPLAVTGRDHPVTSHQAAAWMRDHVTDLNARVFRCIWHRYDQLMSGDYMDNDSKLAYEHRKSHSGFTADELAEVLNGTHQTISARVSSLCKWGWIIDGGARRDTRSGRKAIVYIPSDAARHAVYESDHPAGLSLLPYGGDECGSDPDEAFDSMEEDRRDFESRMP